MQQGRHGVMLTPLGRQSWKVFDSNIDRAIALFSNWGELQNINSEASTQQGSIEAIEKANNGTEKKSIISYN